MAAQDSRCAESRAAADVEQRLVGPGAGQLDFAGIIERRRRHLVRRREAPVADDEIAAVGKRLADVEDRSALARIIVDGQETRVVEEGVDRIRSTGLEGEVGRIGDRIDRPVECAPRTGQIGQ